MLSMDEFNRLHNTDDDTLILHQNIGHMQVNRCILERSDSKPTCRDHLDSLILDVSVQLAMAKVTHCVAGKIHTVKELGSRPTVSARLLSASCRSPPPLLLSSGLFY